jgi:hypothetical protein
MKTSALDRFLDSPDFSALHQADALNESLKDAALNFKNTMSDAMVDSIVQGGNLGDILRGAATDFFTMISKAYMKSAVDTIVGSGGGLLSALFGKKNSGGLIRGGSGSRDDVPTLLTGGEFVVRKGAVEKYGTQFFEGLNMGRVGQMQRGGLYSPGTYGQGAITGQRNLLDFATQSFTGGQFDQVAGGAGFGSAALEPMSARLTMFGRRNSPLFQREQDSQREAFGLYVRQSQHEEEIRRQDEERRSQFRNSLLMAVGTAAFSGIVNGLVPQDPRNPDLPQRDPAAGGVGRSPSRRRGGAAGAIPVGAGRGVGSIVFSDPFGTPDQLGDEFAAAEWGLGATSRVSMDPFTLHTRRLDYEMHMRRVFPDANPIAIRELVRRGAETNYQIPSTRRAAGGYVSPAAGVDTVPTMLSGGEFVMNAAATQNMGRGNLAALNSGGGNGGDDAIVAAINNLGDELEGGGETVINITVNSDGTETQDNNGDEQQQNLALKIKDVVRQVIDEEQRLGGSLRRV